MSDGTVDRPVRASLPRQTVRTAPKRSFLRTCIQQHQLIMMVIPGLILVFIFSYIPMYGALMAFQDYNPAKGVFGSEWVGLKYFNQFLTNPFTPRLFRNTLLLGLYGLLWGFPAPILLALLLDQVTHLRFKKVVQTLSYFPHFISIIVIVGILKDLFAANGTFNDIGALMGKSPTSFLTDPKWFRTLFISSSVWKEIGWGTIIYLAALSGVDPQQHEAATIDGATRWQRVRYVTWPAIVPATTIMLIFAVSGILGADSQKVLLMYSPATYDTADIIGTYVYREGIEGGRYELTTAIGLMMNVISCVMIVLANFVSRSLSENSLW